MIVLASVIIPFINLPESNHSFVSIQIDPLFQGNTIIDYPVQNSGTIPPTNSSITTSDVSHPIVVSTKVVLLLIYLIGVFISLLLFVYSILTAFRLFRKSQKLTLNGIKIMIHNADIPAFSLRRRILISRYDYDNNAKAILAHELSHIRQGHFYDLMLMEFTKIIYWFNPLIYRMSRDLKDIHEFQADEHTISSGVDPVKYQLLIIQKCVGHQSFALANSFNHCQIKKRITMMNKSKTNKAWTWKVATFLPLLAFLLMAFSKRGEILTPNSSLPASVIVQSKLVQKQYEQFKRKIDIKIDGNYIDNKQISLQEIAKTGKDWYKASNDWIFLLIDESVPLSRIDEVRNALGNNYWVVQSTVNSDDLVYFSGDVSESARFKQGKFDDWISSQLKNFPEIKSKGKETIETIPAKDNHPAVIAKIRRVTLSLSYIIGKDGKVRDAHIVKGSGYPEIDAAYEKILSQIPDWIPAKRGGVSVSAYVYSMDTFSSITTLE